MSSERSNEEARRSYWTRIMDEAHNFMQKMIDYPVEECREPMESLIDAVKNAGVEVTFSSRPHAEGQQRMYFLRAAFSHVVIRFPQFRHSRRRIPILLRADASGLPRRFASPATTSCSRD